MDNCRVPSPRAVSSDQSFGRLGTEDEQSGHRHEITCYPVQIVIHVV